MSTMRFADEVVPQKDIDAIPGKGPKPEPKELKLASQIISSLATDWDPTRYHDTYTEELKRLIEAKAKGKEIVVEEEAPATDNVLDLMQALEASLDAARKGGGRKMASEVAKVAEQLAEEAESDDGDDEAPKAKSTKKAPARKPAAKRGPAKKAAARKSPAKKSA
jgi:DNA end-binding protein Ku